MKGLPHNIASYSSMCMLYAVTVAPPHTSTYTESIKDLPYNKASYSSVCMLYAVTVAPLHTHQPTQRAWKTCHTTKLACFCIIIDAVRVRGLSRIYCTQWSYSSCCADINLYIMECMKDTVHVTSHTHLECLHTYMHTGLVSGRWDPSPAPKEMWGRTAKPRPLPYPAI